MTSQQLFKLRDAADINLVGGKAFALGEMLRAGFSVPDGFVVSAATPYIEAVTHNDDMLNAFDELGAKFVAVRSSAINEDGVDAAWAGQLDTFLNCDRTNFIQNVNNCRESANTKRAQSYAMQKGIKSSQVAVIVQEMVDSDISGIAFSVHPVTGNEKQVVIEAGLGLGEAVVSGEITPDTYIINKDDRQIAEKHIATQKRKLVRSVDGKNVWEEVKTNGSIQKLSAEQIEAVLTLTIKLEKFFKYPVDVEWAIRLNTVYVLQCRPITTLG